MRSKQRNVQARPNNTLLNQIEQYKWTIQLLLFFIVSSLAIIALVVLSNYDSIKEAYKSGELKTMFDHSVEKMIRKENKKRIVPFLPDWAFGILTTVVIILIISTLGIIDIHMRKQRQAGLESAPESAQESGLESGLESAPENSEIKAEAEKGFLEMQNKINEYQNTIKILEEKVEEEKISRGRSTSRSSRRSKRERSNSIKREQQFELEITTLKSQRDKAEKDKVRVEKILQLMNGGNNDELVQKYTQLEQILEQNNININAYVDPKKSYDELMKQYHEMEDGKDKNEFLENIDRSKAFKDHLEKERQKVYNQIEKIADDYREKLIEKAKNNTKLQRYKFLKFFQVKDQEVPSEFNGTRIRTPIEQKKKWTPQVFDDHTGGQYKNIPLAYLAVIYSDMRKADNNNVQERMEQMYSVLDEKIRKKEELSDNYAKKITKTVQNIEQNTKKPIKVIKSNKIQNKGSALEGLLFKQR